MSGDRVGGCSFQKLLSSCFLGCCLGAYSVSISHPKEERVEKTPRRESRAPGHCLMSSDMVPAPLHAVTVSSQTTHPDVVGIDVVSILLALGPAQADTTLWI